MYLQIIYVSGKTKVGLIRAVIEDGEEGNEVIIRT